jgi:hypothetical protein
MFGWWQRARERAITAQVAFADEGRKPTLLERLLSMLPPG